MSLFSLLLEPFVSFPLPLLSLFPSKETRKHHQITKSQKQESNFLLSGELTFLSLSKFFVLVEMINQSPIPIQIQIQQIHLFIEVNLISRMNMILLVKTRGKVLVLLISIRILLIILIMDRIQSLRRRRLILLVLEGMISWLWIWGIKELLAVDKVEVICRCK